ncbi:MAG: hypothetical protein N2645_22010 [Clostridia bacterium]|nr:hypothetical protein [Clostridia bacterium]
MQKNVCTYYRMYGLFKRLKGIMGYCDLQKKDIFRYRKAGEIPHIYCEGKKGCSNLQCGVFIYLNKKE